MSKQNNHIRLEAAHWFAKIRESEDEIANKSEFEAWLAEDNAHADAYLAISQTWQAFDNPKNIEALDNAIRRRQSREARYKTAARIAACFMFVVVAALSVQGWYSSPTLQLAHATSIGQILTVPLADGSEIILDADSDTKITFYRDKRTVQLGQGQAIFNVAKDTARPFIVETNLSRVTVLGTRFAVNRINGRDVVSVDHGTVRVESLEPSGNIAYEPLILGAGDVAEVRSDTMPKKLSLKASSAFGFIGKRLVFENADLREVADTLSRYRKKPVSVDEAYSGNSKITAVVRISDIELFLLSLPQIAPVSLINQEKQTLITNQKNK